MTARRPAARFASSAAIHAAFVVLVAMAVSIGTVNHEFVFDDHMLVGGNAPVINGEAPLSSAFTYRYWGAADEVSPNELYRPITIISLGLNARLMGQDPAVFHAVNVALHAINALLVYTLIGILFARPLVALLTALIFSVHPVATEAVATISGRADLLATLFILLTCLFALAASRKRRAWILAGGLGVALAVFMGALSKESAFAAPLLVVAVLGADAQRHRGTKKETREYLITAVTLAGIIVFALAMVLLLRYRILGYVYNTQPPATPSASYLAFVNNPLQFAEPLPRVLTALRVAVRGAGLLIFPVSLSADYSYAQIPVSQSLWSAADLFAVCFALLYLSLVYWSAHRFPLVMFALSWSALTYLIVSNLLFPIGTIFGERLLYLPSIGFALLLACGIMRLAGETGRVEAQPSRRGAVAAVLMLSILALYAGRFVARARDWANDDVLFASTVVSSPESCKAHSNYGFTLQRAGRYDEAIAQYTRALAIAPHMTGTRMSLARTLMQQSRNQEAIDQLQLVVERDPGISVAWSGLGLAQESAEKFTDAEASYRKALDLSLGRNREALTGMAHVMAHTGREERAVELLERMMKNTPDQPELREDLAGAHYLLGVRMLKEGREAEFRAEMGKAVSLDPEHGPAQFNLALDALTSGNVAAARAHAEAARKAGYDFPPGFLGAAGLAEPRPQ